MTPKSPSDLDQPWCRAYCSSPAWTSIPTASLTTKPSRHNSHGASPANALFAVTLWGSRGIRAVRSFASVPPSQGGGQAPEICMLASLGPDLASYPGRAHGAIVTLLLDEAMGTAVERAVPGARLTMATADIQIRFRRPVPAPGVVRVRATVRGDAAQSIKANGDVLTEGSIEDGEGTVLATATASFKSLRRTQIVAKV